jgi:hypothetical protein
MLPPQGIPANGCPNNLRFRQRDHARIAQQPPRASWIGGQGTVP